MQGCIHPISETMNLANLRVHPWEITEAHLLPFMPNGAKLDQEDKKIQKLINGVRKIIADCSSIQAAATYIMANSEWDFFGVYFDAIDHFGHGYMKFHPPKMDHIPQEYFDGFFNIVTAGYRYHDMMLGRLLSFVDEDTTVLLISDHGFHPDHLRPKGIPKIPAGPALEHSPYGIIVAKGPNIKKDHTIYAASLIDITPTLLTIYGLPVAKDMDGKILKDLFIEVPKIEEIESWELIDGDSGMHSPDMLNDQTVSQEALDQLIELGYIEKPDEDVEKAVRKHKNETNFWLAKSYIDGNMNSEALPLLEELYAQNPRT